MDQERAKQRAERKAQQRAKKNKVVAAPPRLANE
jgi:hypothetical protein